MAKLLTRGELAGPTEACGNANRISSFDRLRATLEGYVLGRVRSVRQRTARSRLSDLRSIPDVELGHTARGSRFRARNPLGLGAARQPGKASLFAPRRARRGNG